MEDARGRMSSFDYQSKFVVTTLVTNFKIRGHT